MPRKYPPLECREVKTILKNLGFEERPQKSTSHQHFVKENVGGKFRKVTLDCPKAPFGDFLIKSMIRQSGYSRDQFYRALHENLEE